MPSLDSRSIPCTPPDPQGRASAGGNDRRRTSGDMAEHMLLCRN